MTPAKGLRQLLCLLILFFLGVAAAQARTSLWQVSSGPHTLYLLGSLHVLKKDSYPLPPVMEKAYAESEVLVFETDIDRMESPAIRRKIITYGSQAPGHRLDTQLSPETRERLREKIKALGLPEETFQNLKPWFCALTLTVMELEKLGFLPQYGLDLHFYRKAKADGKDTVFLESPDFQLSLFFSQSRTDQEDFLNQTLTDLELVTRLADDMENAWQKGEAEELQAMIAKSFANYPGQYARLITDRNRNWIPLLEKVLKSHRSGLAVVGAGHLIGPDSVVEMLRRKGYSIEQL